MDVQRLLDGLDPAQRTAVTTASNPLAILAGAGSGKTRVLTRRIAYRCLTGDADARHVLAVTFTRKAAAELDTRLRTFGLRDLPAAGTFHGLAYAQLRTAWAAKGTAPPTLLDRKGSVLARVLGNTRRVRPGDLATEIEWAKARMVGPDDYAATVHRVDRRPPVAAERIADWYRAYETMKGRRGLIDFDDLLIGCAQAIETDPTMAAAQRWRFRHLFVDEYQDVNPLQDRLLRAWLGDRPDLCVVGDPNQAIYGWNGADARYLSDFTRHHPGATVVELRDSYRSTPEILNVAATVLAGGRGRPEPLRAHRSSGPDPVVVGYQSDADEANAVARAVRDLHQPGRPWGAQAVLVRTNAQTVLLEAAFRRAGIAHRVRGASRFLEDPEVVDLLRRLDRLTEPLTATLTDLRSSVAGQRRDLLAESGLLDVDDDGAPPERLELPDSAAARRVVAFEQILRLGEELVAQDPHTRTDALPGWLRTVLLRDGPEAADAVTISTFHAAKGLEWDIVHLAGLEAGLVPISHARSPEARQEEERLFYVAVTRAAEVLRCSWAKTRRFGNDPADRAPSPFLAWVRSAIPGDTGTGSPTRKGPPSITDALSSTRDALGDGDHDERERADAIAGGLRRWRAEQARRAKVSPTVVLSDRAVESIARQRPRSVHDLTVISGLGPSGRQRHGRRLLAIVAEHDDSPGGGAEPVGSPG